MNNPYMGINPHLNSHLQSSGGGWEAFHASCIEKLGDYLEATLPPNYYAISEKSLQVTMLDPQTDVPLTKSSTKPDVMVLQDSQHTNVSSQMQTSTPTLTLPLTDSFIEEDEMMGVVIYRFEVGDLPGKPVARFEVLSPGNKPIGAHYTQYLRNRRITLLAGIRLIEIDWLHESRPIISSIPSYIDRDEGAYPYNIIVNDPQPTIEQGKTHVYGVRVGDKLPIVQIQLNTDDQISVDFEAVYQNTFENRRVFQMLANASREPARFQTYDAFDQETIQQKMREIN